MQLHDEEPAATGWVATSIDALLTDLLAAGADGTEPGPRRPVLLAVDGRGAGGKTTLTERLADAVAGSAVVHVDDISWCEPLFEWGHLLRDGVLAPLRAGQDVHFTPPQWLARGREGAIEVPASSAVVLIEGVGAGQAMVADLLDAIVWVQSDPVAAEQRGIERDVASGVNGDREETIAFWHWWYAGERTFLAADRPWERAARIVAGTATIPLGEGEVAVAPGYLRP